MADSKKGGRPPKAAGTHLAPLTLRFAPDELAQLKAAAAKCGMPFAAWVRIQLRRAAGLSSV